MPTKKFTSLPDLLKRPEVLVVPGGGTALELRLAQLAGFEAGYVSGYATSAAVFGVPDVGLIAYNEVESNVRAIRGATDFPLIVDCDTGYGDIANVQRTVRGLEQAGAAALQFEDQKWPKKCGHMEGKLVEPLDIAVARIKAAVAARSSKDFLIVARTDARSPLGFDAAIDRLRAYKDAGADVLFMDAPYSREELEKTASALPGPKVANMSETGKTPLFSAKELGEMGYKIALFPSSTLRVMQRHVSLFLADLRKTGDSRPWLDRMASLDETNEALGLPELNATGDKIRAA